MSEFPPITAQIKELRKRAAELAEKAKRAQTDEARQTMRDLAELYNEMAVSVAQLEALRANMCEQKAD
jgi:hypothetical protein